MANEIFLRTQIIWDYKVAARTISEERVFRADALARYNTVLQVVGTSWETLEVGDLAKQWMILTNLDTVNFVSWGKSVADATELLRIPPGASLLIYLTAANTAVLADTANCELQIFGVEGND